MIICDVCKQDPIREAKSEALRANPWAVLFQPPPGSGLPSRGICWPCWDLMFDALLEYAAMLRATKKAN